MRLDVNQIEGKAGERRSSGMRRQPSDRGEEAG